MVLITAKSKIFVTVLFLINVPPAFSQWRVSGLLQYGENIDKERLELLEDGQVIQFDRNMKYFVTSTYTIRNTSDEYTARLGLLLQGWQAHTTDAASDIQFFVDGAQVPHTEPVESHEFVMDGIRRGVPQIYTAWALIDVIFPEGSSRTIEVRYAIPKDETNYTEMMYNQFYYVITEFPGLDYWRGTPKFSVEIINDYVREGDTVEYKWMTSMSFYSIGDYFDTAFNTENYFFGLQSLETDLMRIQRLNARTVKIEFTPKFINEYRRAFKIYYALWTFDIGDYDLAPLMFGEDYEGYFDLAEYDGHSWELNLQYMRDNRIVSQRELSPYELIFFTPSQLRVIRNAFYARHGFVFQSSDLQNMFNAVPRYVPNPDFTEDMLTETDRANIATIQRLEALAGD
jgi:hypothetical protein